MKFALYTRNVFNTPRNNYVRCVGSGGTCYTFPRKLQCNLVTISTIIIAHKYRPYFQILHVKSSQCSLWLHIVLCFLFSSFFSSYTLVEACDWHWKRSFSLGSLSAPNLIFPLKFPSFFSLSLLPFVADSFCSLRRLITGNSGTEQTGIEKSLTSSMELERELFLPRYSSLLVSIGIRVCFVHCRFEIDANTAHVLTVYEEE